MEQSQTAKELIEALRQGPNALTHDKIAEAVNASPRQVYRWAKGENEPLPIYKQALAALVGKRQPSPKPQAQAA